MATGAAPGQEFPPPGSWEHSLSSCQPGDAMHEIILKGSGSSFLTLQYIVRYYFVSGTYHNIHITRLLYFDMEHSILKMKFGGHYYHSLAKRVR